jgi:PWWP domain
MALNASEGKFTVTTIHWDPTEANKIGWKARLLSGTDWQDGRITMYDPYSHKHKIELDVDEDNCFEDPANPKQKKRKYKKTSAFWMRLRHEDVQLATRIVWAHVRGYAWWPAMVMELTCPSSTMASPREGHVFVHFIGAPEVATLRDVPDCIRPFSSIQTDPVIEKSKKKRNSKAISQAQREEVQLQNFKNQAARHYAAKAFAMADTSRKLVGKRVKLFSSDIHYPDGATVVGTVRQYSTYQKKWLVSFELSYKLKHKVSAAWINFDSKDCSHTVLKGDSTIDSISTKPARKAGVKQQPYPDVEPTDVDLVPFLFGFECKVSEKSSAVAKGKKKDSDEMDEADDIDSQLETDALLANILKERCRGCVDVWSGDYTVTCVDCEGMYHLGCVDPPISKETYQRMMKEGGGKVVGWKCAKCTICLGCYQKDIVYGSHALVPQPATVSFPIGVPLYLCSMCVKAYEAKKYCPNCAHSWDDVKYQKVLDQLEEEGLGPPEEPAPAKKGRKVVEDDDSVGTDATDTVLSVSKGMPPNTPFAGGTLLNGARVDPAWYHAENNIWGYTEGDMLVCDSCDLWVHAGCGGLSKQEYERTSEGNIRYTARSSFAECAAASVVWISLRD